MSEKINYEKKHYLRLGEVVDWLNYNEKSVRKLIAEEELKGFYLKGKASLRITSESVVNYVKKKMKEFKPEDEV